VELKRLSKELLADKKTAQKLFLLPVLRNEGNFWSEFYKYVKMHKGNREIIPAIKDHNGTIITDSTEKANVLNSSYASVFCCDRSIPKIELANWVKRLLSTVKLLEKDYKKSGQTNQ
jgi:hypothetical protein